MMSMFHVRVVRSIVAVLVAVGVLGVAIKAQDRIPHRIVFEVTSADPQAWEAVLNNSKTFSERSESTSQKSESSPTAKASASS